MKGGGLWGFLGTDLNGFERMTQIFEEEMSVLRVESEVRLI